MTRLLCWLFGHRPGACLHYIVDHLLPKMSYYPQWVKITQCQACKQIILLEHGDANPSKMPYSLPILRTPGIFVQVRNKFFSRNA